MHTSAVIEFLLWLLIVASLIAFITRALRLPYTIALVIGGFLIDLFHLPIAQVFGEGGGPAHLLTPEVIFTLFLPGLLFEAGINIHVRRLRENIIPISLLAVVGVLLATLITGFAAHWIVGLPLMVALVFGALISATDPISVLALFKSMGVNKRLSLIVEGESLFNDGTAVVVFQILVAGMITGKFSIAYGLGRFAVVAVGGAVLGLGLGYVASLVTKRIDDASVEITLSTILAYGSYLVAEHLHVSGIIAVVAAGLMVGSFGAEVGMSARTKVALWSFWEYLAFVINSLVFLLIGMEVHVLDLLGAWRAILLSIVAVLIGRLVTVYSLTPLSNRFSKKIPVSWQHVLVWGGLHGGVSMALVLSLGKDVPMKSTLLAMTFGVVAFSIIGQGLTVKPLLSLLHLCEDKETDYHRLRVKQQGVAAARAELERLLDANEVSKPVYRKLKKELEALGNDAEEEMSNLLKKDSSLTGEEEKLTRRSLLKARKTAVQKALNAGLINMHSAEEMLSEIDEELNSLRRNED